jgi:hypothetical protein
MAKCAPKRSPPGAENGRGCVEKCATVSDLMAQYVSFSYTFTVSNQRNARMGALKLHFRGTYVFCSIRHYAERYG